MFSGLSPAQPSARRWTALASFAVQAALITATLVLPMLYPQNLPQVFLARRIFVPMAKGEVQADVRPAGTGSGDPVHTIALLVSRSRFIFRNHAEGPDSGPKAPALDPGAPDGLDLHHLVSISPAIPPLPPKAPDHIRTSVVMEGNLIRRVEPQDPPIAKQIHLEGSVVLKAIISREGNIEQVQVASGPSLLARAARDAVGQWKYRPYLLNGEPVEVETQITVNFVLEH